MQGLTEGRDGLVRCAWCASDPLYADYHDREWGRPSSNDHRLFEKICLEGFQSGLSWLTILKKRERFRKVFCDFDFEKVARFGAKDVDRLLADPGIVRHRGKIEATIHNAGKALELREREGSLAAYLYGFVPPASERPAKLTWTALKKLARTKTSERLAKDLKARGWKFFGPTTAYAFMQAMGMVNDHVEGCALRAETESARRTFLGAR